MWWSSRLWIFSTYFRALPTWYWWQRPWIWCFPSQKCVLKGHMIWNLPHCSSTASLDLPSAKVAKTWQEGQKWPPPFSRASTLTILSIWAALLSFLSPAFHQSHYPPKSISPWWYHHQCSKPFDKQMIALLTMGRSTIGSNFLKNSPQLAEPSLLGYEIPWGMN